MVHLNQGTLTNYDLVLITSGKRSVESLTLLGLLYHKQIPFFHIEINSKNGESEARRAIEKLGITVPSDDSDFAPAAFVPRLKDQNAGMVISKPIVFQFIDEMFPFSPSIPDKLSIWSTDADVNFSGAKAVIEIHSRLIDELFGAAFDAYCRGNISDDDKKQYETMIVESLTRRSDAHITDSTFALSNEQNALDLHYMAIIHLLVNTPHSFIHGDGFNEWRSYYRQLSARPSFKLTFEHSPDISI